MFDIWNSAAQSYRQVTHWLAGLLAGQAANPSARGGLVHPIGRRYPVYATILTPVIRPCGATRSSGLHTTCPNSRRPASSVFTVGIRLHTGRYVTKLPCYIDEHVMLRPVSVRSCSRPSMRDHVRAPYEVGGRATALWQPRRAPQLRRPTALSPLPPSDRGGNLFMRQAPSRAPPSNAASSLRPWQRTQAGESCNKASMPVPRCCEGSTLMPRDVRRLLATSNRFSKISVKRDSTD